MCVCLYICTYISNVCGMSILIELFVSKEKECFLAESIIINYSSNFY